MSYLNGKDVFPPALLKEIQRYAQGTCVYIPRIDKKQRQHSPLDERNRAIRREYASGQPVKALAEAYFLSPQAIYKILSDRRE